MKNKSFFVLKVPFIQKKDGTILILGDPVLCLKDNHTKTFNIFLQKLKNGIRESELESELKNKQLKQLITTLEKKGFLAKQQMMPLNDHERHERTLSWLHIN